MSTIKSSAENLTLNADGANNDVIIQSNGSTKVTVDGANGRVGIGQATPATELHIGLNDSSNHHATLTLNNGGATGNQAGINWKYENETNPRARVYLDSSGQELRFDTGNSERMRVTADGLTFNGDTAAANALDDYETGTWTIGISFGGGTTSVAYGARYGTYTKIGNRVILTGRLILTSKGSSSGAAVITGLPFASGSNGGASVSGGLYHVDFANQWKLNLDQSASTILIFEMTESGAETAITAAEFDNNAQIFISVSYNI
jgi:hypothetical protein